MDISYRLIVNRDARIQAAQRLIDEHSMWALEPSIDGITAEQWADAASGPEVAVIGGYVDGEPAGIAVLKPFCPVSLCGEFAVAAYRKFYHMGIELARGVVAYIFQNFDCISLVGKVPAPNRHIMRLCAACGFRELGNVPGLMWYGRKHKFVDGKLCIATPDSLAEVTGGL